MKSHTHYTFDTEYSADSVEFCPVEPFQNVFAIGTYQVIKNEEQKQDVHDGSSDEESGYFSPEMSRLGRIYVKGIDNNGAVVDYDRLETNAVLDMKWSFHNLLDNGSTCLGVVDSKGFTSIYGLSDENKLRVLASHKNETDGVLALSLDWSNRLDQTPNPNIIVSNSDGSLCLYNLTSTGLTPLETLSAHTLEAWTAAFDYHSPNIFYSGADDLLFKAWDTRILPTPTYTNKKEHEAGVTTISSHPLCEHRLLTGSYDEYVRIWDKRMLSKGPMNKFSIGGGVWRLRWHPTNPEWVLAAGMYNGFWILDVKGVESDQPEMSSLLHYTGHDSIAYGADWCYAPPIHDGPTVGTCSFYDHLFHLWSVEE